MTRHQVRLKPDTTTAFRILAVVFAAAATGLVTSRAQVGRGGSEWLTARGDAQRTSWIRADAKISVETMSAPAGPSSFAKQWTSRLDNQPRRDHGLGQGVTANGVTLFVPMSIVTGSSNNVYGIDNDTGYVVWQRHFDAAMPAATDACPGGVTGAATRIVSVALPQPPAPPRAGAPGRAGYRSLLGEPSQGVPVEPRAGGPPPPPPAPAAARGAAPPSTALGAGAAPPAPALPINPASGRAMADEFTIPGAPPGAVGSLYWKASGVVYAMSSDGQLHVMGLASGKDIQPPAPFLPANARWSSAIGVGTMLYASTSGNCGGAPNAVWAIDLQSESKLIVSWKENGGSILGPVAFTPSGTLIAVVGPGPTTGGRANTVVALDAKTLQVKDWFTSPSAALATGPTIFRRNDKDIVAVATSDGRVLLLDAASLGGANHATPLHASPVVGPIAANASLAAWQDSAGTQWILAPTGATVQALKLADSAGALSLGRAWTAEKIAAPSTPIIVNGVVFALSTDRAVLQAFDGATGKPLWNSGTAMTGPASPGSFWSAMGQVYVGMRDGTLHAFGFLDERR